jgi:hypothetical protein
MRVELIHAICCDLLIFFVKLLGRPASEAERSFAAGRFNYRIGNEVIFFKPEKDGTTAPAAGST